MNLVVLFYELRIFRKKSVQYRYIVAHHHFLMVHKIKYFEADKLEDGIYLQDVVNDFLAEKGEKIIAVHPIMEKTLLVHYTE
jgi:hypothetical protein